jgi:hypothetical protein
MAETLSCGVVEVARVGAVAGQLPSERVVVDHELVGVQLAASRNQVFNLVAVVPDRLT